MRRPERRKPATIGIVDAEQLRALLTAVSEGRTAVDQAVARLKRLPFERLAFATVDHHRALRCGHPEVIFCAGKTVAQVVEIARRLADGGGCVLATRASGEQIAALREVFGSAAVVNEPGRCVLVNAPAMAEARAGMPHVALVSAGTADAPVVEEAATTLWSMRAPMKRLDDVGVSGLHRLLGQLEALQGACAVVVVAGMEGALPSVVGGLVACPVYAVPTSVGYGAGLGGVAALLGMLNSCASNVSVVNIDNGFGAAYSAALVHQQVAAIASAHER
jgi:NCAIR mutase (PurE)-related protein